MKLTSLSVVALALGLIACGKKPTTAAPPTIEAVAETVTVQSIPVDFTLVGRCEPQQTVEIRARITGTLIERPFVEGTLVKEGDVLFRIDQTEFAADLETARARLAQAEARQAQAQLDLERLEPLAKAGAAPRKELDDAKTALINAEADVRYAQATVVNAQLQLSYTTITAPFAGLVGRAKRDPGAIVSPADGSLVTLDKVDPIAVNFAISEREFLALRRDVDAGVIIMPKRDELSVHLQLLDGTKLEEEGRIDFRDVRIRPETGSAQLRAHFPNQGGKLFPGQFTRVFVQGMSRPKAILVPQSAILQSPTGAAVYVIAEDGTAEARPVQASAWVEDRWLILDGLSEGERIVVDGLQGVVVGKPVTLAAEGAKPAAPASAAGDTKPAETKADK